MSDLNGLLGPNSLKMLFAVPLRLSTGAGTTVISPHHLRGEV
jgi:hypothetical protein